MLNANTNDGRNLVLIIPADNSGCSHYRLRWNALYYAGHDLGFTPVMCPFPIFDAAWLVKTKAIIFQRPISEYHANIVERYKAIQPRFGYKMIFEVDDLIFKINDHHCIPEYNTAAMHFDADKSTEMCKRVLPMMDEIIVSTDFLKRKFEESFDVHNVHVIRNVIPRFLWSYPRKKNITEDIIKPTVLYSGSPCHYRNPIPPRQPSPQEPNGFPGISPHKGDMDNAWCDWVIKNVREDKINFIVMGALPWFWECIKDKITFIPWVDCNSFPRQVMETNADFSIAPLVDNDFNKCKSSLRFTESCAAGQVFLGTVFDTNKDSPYEEVHTMSKVPASATVADIDEKFWKLCNKDEYNKVLNWQYDHINKGSYWLESSYHANLWLSMIDSVSSADSFI